MTTALTISLALPSAAQQVETIRLDRNAGSPILSGALLALLMLGVAGIGSDGGGGEGSGPDPDPGPDPDYAPPGGYQGDLRPRYVIGVTPFSGDPELGTGADRLTFETPEYFEGWGLDRINAAARYAEGAFGAGALVSLFDSGIDPDHPELGGAYLADQSHSYFAGEMTDLNGHGSHVAGIIAAARDGTGMHGVAPEARILAFRALDGPEAERAGLFFQNWEDAMLRSVEAGADVMNNSWTFVNEDERPVRITDLTSREDAIAYFGTDLIGTMAYAAQQDLVSVYAAGNGDGGESSITAGLPVHIGEIRDHWVSVVALNEDDTIADYSSRCGIAAEWCLAAPGTNILSTGADGGYELRSGSSMAAGFVSGSLALLKSNFPEITGATALTILKDTARDLGEAGVDPVFGHGAIDLETAMRPAGEMSVQLSSALNERTAPLLSSGIVAPSGVADPMRRALSASLMSTTDAYDRSFQIPMGAMVASRGAPDQSAQLARFTLRGARSGLPDAAGTYLTSGAPVTNGGGVLPDAEGFRAGHAGLLGDRALGLSHKADLGSGVRFGFTGATDTGSGTSGAAYASLTLSADIGNSTLTMEAGRVRESDGMLGATFHGAFDGVRADTRFLRASADLAISENDTLHLSASTGDTDASGSGLFRSGRVRSESFGVGMSRRNDQTGSVMSFGVSRPLGVSGGSMDMIVPVGVSAASEGVASEKVQVQGLSVDLDGGDVPFDLQFGYELPVGSARLGMAVSHRVGSDPKSGTSASLGISLRF
jgi:hypothetical protein